MDVCVPAGAGGAGPGHELSQAGGRRVTGHLQPPAARRHGAHHGDGDLWRVRRAAGAGHADEPQAAAAAGAEARTLEPAPEGAVPFQRGRRGHHAVGPGRRRRQPAAVAVSPRRTGRGRGGRRHLPGHQAVDAAVPHRLELLGRGLAGRGHDPGVLDSRGHRGRFDRQRGAGGFVRVELEDVCGKPGHAGFGDLYAAGAGGYGVQGDCGSGYQMVTEGVDAFEDLSVAGGCGGDV